ncbi:hypothetical protein [Microbacterium amylolyticum]|uniref:Acyl-coenzyme A synthetase/AMP-(Fatty) acid ligase n=1 Tax=Microbacterium amylolyticum TaxID=936337 RepID=A0ABS4ZHN2_9MICO|nr:hypothetical protein [Microbacterium amylolyticum]MBP2436712.1 acyl-coenzyme A synthetase/AMP-(fatty) acid ligase [Microbacterium amylolyticum]
MNVDSRMVVGALPLTANGKRDDRALRDMWERRVAEEEEKA